jgi:hypothetical protein
MRAFSSFEKELIDKLVQDESLHEQGLVQMAYFLEKHYFGENFGISIMYKNGGSAFISARTPEVNEARKQFVSSISVFNTFRELRDLGLIVLIGEPTPQGTLGYQYQGGRTCELPAPINMFVADVLPKHIVVSEDLKQLSSDKFLSPEHQRHKQTVFISITAIFVSLIIGAASVGIAISNCSGNSKHNEALQPTAQLAGASRVPSAAFGCSGGG